MNRQNRPSLGAVQAAVLFQMLLLQSSSFSICPTETIQTRTDTGLLDLIANVTKDARLPIWLGRDRSAQDCRSRLLALRRETATLGGQHPQWLFKRVAGLDGPWADVTVTADLDSICIIFICKYSAVTP